MNKNLIKSTTIVGIRKDNLVVIAGDGQASLGNTVMKSNVKKLDDLELRKRLFLVLLDLPQMLLLCLKD